MVMEVTYLNPKATFDRYDEHITCSACETVHPIEVLKKTCPVCTEVLFEPMFKSEFRKTFKQFLESINIDADKIRSFFANEVCLKHIGVCNELTILLDINMYNRFGSKYKSCCNNESWGYIQNYNYNYGN